MQWLAFGIRSGIEENEMPLDGRHHRDDGGAFDSFETPETERRSGDETAGVAERNNRIGFSIANQRDGAHDRSILLPANGGERVVLHRQHLAWR